MILAEISNAEAWWLSFAAALGVLGLFWFLWTLADEWGAGFVAFWTVVLAAVVGGTMWVAHGLMVGF